MTAPSPPLREWPPTGVLAPVVRQAIFSETTHPCLDEPVIFRERCPCRFAYIIVATTPNGAGPPNATWSLTLSPVEDNGDRDGDGDRDGGGGDGSGGTGSGDGVGNGDSNSSGRLSPAAQKARVATLHEYSRTGIVAEVRPPALLSPPDGFVAIPDGFENWTAGIQQVRVPAPGLTQLTIALDDGSSRSACNATVIVQFRALPTPCPVQCIDAGGDCQGQDLAEVATTAATATTSVRAGERRHLDGGGGLPAVASRLQSGAGSGGTARPPPALPARTTRVIGGRELESDDQRRMLVYAPALEDAYCSGSVISPVHILTAAHCFFVAGDTVYIGGSVSIRGAPRTISRVFAHPDFGGDQGLNDIAVLVITTPVRSPNDGVPVMQLPRACDAPLFGTYARAAGYGDTDVMLRINGSMAELLYLDVPLLAKDECLAAYERAAAGQPLSGLTNQIEAPSLLCAGYLSGGCDTCTGDSGGPLYQSVTRTVNFVEETSYMQVGVTSFGSTCAAPDQPGVYTLVAPYVEWIEGVVENSGGWSKGGSPPEQTHLIGGSGAPESSYRGPESGGEGGGEDGADHTAGPSGVEEAADGGGGGAESATGVAEPAATDGDGDGDGGGDGVGAVPPGAAANGGAGDAVDDTPTPGSTSAERGAAGDDASRGGGAAVWVIVLAAGGSVAAFTIVVVVAATYHLRRTGAATAGGGRSRGGGGGVGRAEP